MKRYKITAFFTVLLIVLSVFPACGKTGYNAKIYNMSEESFSSSFLEENKVKGAYYKNPDYAEGSDEKYYYDETSPACRTFIVNNSGDYSLIFTGNELTVNFDKEMLLIYIFADVNPCRNYLLNKVVVDGETAKIYFGLEKGDKKDATAPYQRVLIVKTDKLDINEAEFIKQR